MEKNLPKINKQRISDPPVNPVDVESIVRDFQIRILRRTSNIPRDKRISIRLVREFEWSSNWAETLASSIENDSRYSHTPGTTLPHHHNPEPLFDLFKLEDSLTTSDSSELNRTECAGVAERLKHFRVMDIDDAYLDAMYEACNWVVVESITEENCLRELETAQDSIHRAELFMMMGNDVEAFREFKKITHEESGNPDNTLALVDLVERYESAKSAIKILRKWFLLEVVLHSLTNDLVSDLLSDRKKIETSPRIRYLQSILLHSGEMTDEELKQQLVLVLPIETTVLPELEEIDKRLGKFGLSMNSMDLILDENEPISLYSLIGSVTEQLLHLADLSRNTNNTKLAIRALERAVLGCFILINLPEPIVDELSCFDDTEMMITHRVITDYLDDMEEILEEILVFFDSDIQHHVLSNQISALRSLIKRQPATNILEDSDGMSRMPREHGSH